MKSYLIILLVLMVGSNGFGQSEKNRQKETGEKESGNTRYSEGASGVKRSISYKFISGKHQAGTGKGTFCFDSDNINSLIHMFADNFDLSGEDQSKWYSTWDDTTGATGRGRITIVEYEGDNTMILDVKGVLVKDAGFWKIPVECISGRMPADGKIYYYIFSRIAHGKEKNPSETQVKPEQEPQKTSPETQPVVTEAVQQVIVNETQQALPEEQSGVTETVVQQVLNEPEPQVAPQQVIPEPEVMPEVQPQAAPQQVTPEPQISESQQQASEPAAPTQQVFQEPMTQETTPEPSQTLPVTNNAPAVSQPVTANEQKPVTFINVKEDRRKPADRSTSQPQRTEDRLRQVSTIRQPKENVTSKPIVNPVSENSSAPPSYQANLPSYSPVASQYSQGRGHGKCYSGIIEVGYGLGVGEYGIDNFRFNFINGFHIGPTFTMGLGLGLRCYYPESSLDRRLVQGKTHMPVFLDLRKRFSTRTVTPYLALGIGSSAVFVNDGDTTRTEYEGLLLNPSGGIWINISSRIAVFAGVAYELQKLEFAMLSDDRRFKQNAGSVSFNIGISF